MALSAFEDKALNPTADQLTRILGPADDAWRHLVSRMDDRHGPLTVEWTFSGANYGWSCRLRQKKRTILTKGKAARTGVLLAGLLIGQAGLAAAQDGIRTERIRFEPGATSAVVEGSITGYEIVDYLVGADEGQSANISMGTDNSASYFNILPPGENEVAVFIGSILGNEYEGELPASGDYRIRVYMMRSAARRDEVANYRLEVIIDAAGPGPVESEPKLREGTAMKPEDKDRTIDYVEFPVTDMGVAKEFYSGVFGWKMTDYGPDYTSFEDGRLTGGFRAETEVIRGGALVVLYSTDLEAIEATIREHGGRIVQEIFEFPGGRRFHFLDPSGNELAVWSEL